VSGEGAPSGPRAASAVELKAQLEAERAGLPFLVYRDGAGEQRIMALDAHRGSLWIGRQSGVDVCLDWDAQVSGLHAQLEVVGSECTIVDDGLSRNGSYVNGERVHGRRRLRDADMLRLGETVVLYRVPGAAVSDSTVAATDLLTEASLTESQRRVLVALCRPFKESPQYATPASNQQIADDVFLSVDAVKTHLRALFAKFGVEELPQNRKRAALVERALSSGLISEREL
jgi:pSer/pThr/pTyr-binding forkhead associated (FHA) protein